MINIIRRYRTREACLTYALLLACALPSPYTWAQPPLEHAARLLQQIESSDGGSIGGLSEEAIATQLKDAEVAVSSYLKDYPNDAAALVVSARLAMSRQVLRPTILTPGREPPDLDAGVAPIHQTLDRALQLQPDNAEANYWKARIFGLRRPTIRDGRIYYPSMDLPQAILFSRRAVALASTNTRYREALALYLVEDQREAEAIEVIGVADNGRHPIHLLLKDLAGLPIPQNALLSKVDSQSFAQQQMERRRIKDYPSLRVRFIVIPMTLVQLEEFSSKQWGQAKFFAQGGSKRVGDGEIRFFRQYLVQEGDLLRPVSSEADIPDSPGSGVLLNVIQFHNLPEKMRVKTPAGFDLPNNIGETYCYLIVVNFRRTG